MFIPVIVWFGIVMGIVRAVKGNFKNANTRTATRTPQRRQMGRTAFSKPQPTVNLQTCEETFISVKGRHDPCIVPRAVPVVEAAAAIAIYDLILGNTQTERRK